MLTLHKKPAAGYLAATLSVVAATGVSWSARNYLKGEYASLLYLLVIVASATVAGAGPALLAAVLGFLCWNFFFIEPVGTFRVHDPKEWLALSVFLIVGVLCAILASRARAAAQVEALREADKLKSAVLSSVSHDLRTPLSAIIASVTSLQENASQLDADSQSDLLQTVHDSAKRLDNLIGDLLDLSSIEAGVWRPGKELNHLTNAIGIVLDRFAESLNQRIHVDFPSDLPPVPMDCTQIAQVLWNLLDNALKYSPAETPVRVSARSDPHAVTVRVSDLGGGVPPSERQKIFEKFHRAQRPEGSRVPGTGMGLAICKGIIEAHSGRIWVEANEERGATFCFTLPDANDAK